MAEGQLLWGPADIHRVLRRMAGEIAERHRGVENLALVGIRRRGVPLAQRLEAELRATESTPVPLGTLDITLYRDDLSVIGPSPLVRATDLPFEVEGETIILVDDVLYTGRTVRAALDALMDYGRPAKIELAVLIDRGHRELPIQADYVGQVVHTDRGQVVHVKLREVDGEDAVVVETGGGEGSSS